MDHPQERELYYKYEEEAGSLSLHHDSAAISCVLALNEEYEEVVHTLETAETT